MRLVTFRGQAESDRLGAILDADHILDLAAAAEARKEPAPAMASMQTLIDGGDASWEQARLLIERAPEAAILRRDSVRLRAPLPRPVRLRDCSLYLEHLQKTLDRWAHNIASKATDPDAALEELVASGKFTVRPVMQTQVVYYNANHLGVVGPDEDIIWPAQSNYIDYELEWACVIGRPGSKVRSSEARRSIFGYTIFNDWSARDIQMPILETMHGPGESKDFANSIGPCIVTPDELSDPYALQMRALVNGEIWSQGSTGTMHHSFEDAIVQFSQSQPLVAGEIIGSGTVVGGCGYEQGRRLQSGDLVTLEIDGIGSLSNRVRHAA